jgi:curved DNA-binding protein CbpA
MNSETYFDLLGVDLDVEPGELKGAYRRAARDAHPDAGGSEERFKALQEAYEVLSDPDQRRLYTAEVLLAQTRARMRSTYLPASDYVPLLFDVLDPDDRFHSANGHQAGSSGRDGPSRDDEPDRAADDAAAPGPSGTPADADADPDETFEDRAERDFRVGYRSALDAEVAERMRGATSFGWRWRLFGLMLALATWWSGLALWDSGILPTLLGVDDGMRVWLFRTWEGHLHDRTPGVSLILPLLLGPTLVGYLAAMDRRYWVPWWLPRVALPAAAVVAGWTMPLWVGRPWYWIPVFLAGWWAWTRYSRGRYLTSAWAKKQGLTVVDSDDPRYAYKVTLDDETLAAWEDERRYEEKMRSFGRDVGRDW